MSNDGSPCLSESKLFELRNGLVYRKSKGKLLFYVPKSMETQVISTYHDDIGHTGVNKTVELISRSYWFPELKEIVKNYISTCLKCIAYSGNTNKKEGFLHSIPKGDVPFNTIHIDHFGPLEKTQNKYKHILVVIDAFTKFVKLYPCTNTDSKQVIKHLDCYFAEYSKPLRIVSDRGSCFTSEEFRTFLSNYDIQLVLIATGMPQANGQVEVINKSIRAMCAKLMEDPSKWDKVLNEVEFAINNTVNVSTRQTPSMLLFGINQRGKINDNLREYLMGKINVLNRDLDSIREAASRKIESSQTYNKTYFDKGRKVPHSYEIGDLVMIANTDTTAGANKKLIPKFKGTYVIKGILDHDRYVVTDLEGFQIAQTPYEGIVSPSRIRLWQNQNQEV